LNEFKHFKLTVQELNVHFIHERSANASAVPLILIHGWPGSVWEFHKIIPLLTDPKDGQQAFHVVVPSLPGFGWSDPAKEPGMGVVKIASMFNELMTRLGYSKYVAQGGDWGSVVSAQLGFDFPMNCVAIHLNMPIFIPTEPSVWNAYLALRLGIDMSPIGKLYLSERDLDAIARVKEYLMSGIFYLLLQSSKPHTLGDGLNDSPSGLLSWMTEKCYLWMDIRGGIFQNMSKDELLTNVMIYWVTNSISSSLRIYYETLPFGKRFSDSIQLRDCTFVEVPTAFAMFPREAIAFPLRSLKERYNAKQVSYFDKGGHFPAWEQPELLAQDIRKFMYQTLTFEKACQGAEDRKKNGSPFAAATMRRQKLMWILGLIVAAAFVMRRMRK